MAPALRERLSASFVRRLCQDRIEVHRAYVESDGMGGVTTTWRKLATIPARMINKADSEQQPGGGIEPVATWELMAPVSADIRPQDRISIPGSYGRVFEVVGSNNGQADQLIQSIGLVERNV